jgi:acyl carrier protein phosphodiesterase
MNWLAHVVLSEPSPRFRVGNILPDILGLRALAPLGDEFQRGITCHRAIDIFTDDHPVFHRSRTRFHDGYRRFAAILVDVFYDHLLARHWSDHVDTPLPDFVAAFYDDLVNVRPEVPESVHPLLDHLRREDWLGANASVDGPRGAIQRVERRLSWRVDLSGAAAVFAREEAALAEDFREFFPELTAHVRGLGFRIPAIRATSGSPRRGAKEWQPHSA